MGHRGDLIDPRQDVVDAAHVFLGVRLNDWVFGIVVILAAAFLARSFSRLQPAPDALLSQKE